MSPAPRPYDSLKRGLDVAGALVGGAILLPVMGAVALGVAARLGRPVLFRQLRAGRDGRPFHIVKFRTMTDARGPDGQPLSDDARLSPFGRWLRATSLDELPELWNVLRGDMSLVGPRPLLLEYVPRYTAAQAERLAVRPGITGWAQVHGRNALPWDEKFELDRWYVRHLSLRLDLRILARTLGLVLRREGVDSPEGPGAPLFEGAAP